MPEIVGDAALLFTMGSPNPLKGDPDSRTGHRAAGTLVV
jgi:hypothetical protein